MTRTPTPLALPDSRYRWREADTCSIHDDALDTDGACGTCRTERTYSGTAAPIPRYILEHWARVDKEAGSND